MSVRKRSWTNANGEAKSAWVVDYTDQMGKRRLKTFARKKEADAFALNSGVEVRDGVHVADSATVTLRDAGKNWLRACTDANLERSTLASYRQHLELHIEPFIGDTKLSKITAPAVHAFQEQLRDAGRSTAMIKRVTVSLGGILSEAQSHGLVVRNAVHEMSKSRARRGAKVEKRQKAKPRYGVDIPTNDEIKRIIEAATGRYRPLLITAIFTGMRASELRGLTWADVHLGKALVHVRQRADQYQAIGMPKSDAGQRTIPLPPLAVTTLAEWLIECPKGDLGLVFPNSAGNIEWHANIVKRGLHPIQIAAGVTAPTDDADNLGAKYNGMHALRHWFASWCINRKIDGGLELSPKAVQTRMGHSSIQVTFDTYGHLFPAVDEGKALEEAERALFTANAT